jgi:hypothetical protein
MTRKSSVTILFPVYLALLVSGCMFWKPARPETLQTAQNPDAQLSTSDSERAFWRAELPKGWPDNLPIMPGFSVTHGSSSDQGNMLMVNAEGNASFDEVEAYYANLKGWKSESQKGTSKSGDYRWVTLTNESRESADIDISSFSGKTTIGFIFVRDTGKLQAEGQVSTSDTVETTQQSIYMPEKGAVHAFGAFPPNWPDSIPIMKGLTVTFGASENNGNVLNADLEGNLSIDEVMGFYSKIDGWTRAVSREQQYPEKHVRAFVSDKKETLQIYVSQESGKTEVMMIYTKPPSR